MKINKKIKSLSKNVHFEQIKIVTLYNLPKSSINNQDNYDDEFLFENLDD